jgi:vacuolar-type H+-ATPase subunit D/Vma8
VEGTRRAIQNECHKGIAEVRAEKDRNMTILNDKSQSIRDEFHQLTATTKESISKIEKEAIDTMDITLVAVLNQTNRAVESVIEGPEF